MLKTLKKAVYIGILSTLVSLTSNCKQQPIKENTLENTIQKENNNCETLNRVEGKDKFFRLMIEGQTFTYQLMFVYNNGYDFDYDGSYKNYLIKVGKYPLQGKQPFSNLPECDCNFSIKRNTHQTINTILSSGGISKGISYHPWKAELSCNLDDDPEREIWTGNDEMKSFQNQSD